MPAWEIGLIVLVVCLVAAAGFYYFWRKERYWGKGIFPPNLKYSSKSRMKAYFIAATVILMKERSTMASRLAFVNGWFQQEFPEETGDFSVDYKEALSRKVSLKSLAAWLNKHISTDDKQRLADFLFELSRYDGNINDQEYNALKVFVVHLQLDWQPFEEKMKPKNNDRFGSNYSFVEKYLRLLGLTLQNSKEEVKTAYRRLVMLYHPDKYARDTAEVQQAAADKFREIREAYEVLMESVW